MVQNLIYTRKLIVHLKYNAFATSYSCYFRRKRSDIKYFVAKTKEGTRTPSQTEETDVLDVRRVSDVTCVKRVLYYSSGLCFKPGY